MLVHHPTAHPHTDRIQKMSFANAKNNRKRKKLNLPLGRLRRAQQNHQSEQKGRNTNEWFVMNSNQDFLFKSRPALDSTSVQK
jgi:hypothetical protein